MAAPAHTTLLEIVNLVATSVGHPTTTDALATQDEAIRRMSYYANAACIDLMMMHNWQQFSKTCIIPVVATVQGELETSFPLPTDFKVMTDDTHWNRSTQLPAIGPVNPQDWQWLVVRNTKITTRFMWRIRDGLLWVKTAPYPTAQNFSFEYLSKNWAVDGITGFGKDYLSGNNDYHLFPWELVVYSCRAKWLENEGYDAKAAKADFQKAFLYETGTDKGATAISLVPGMGYPYIDAIRNIPDTGYGGAA
jgi:hypothetical protein